MVVRTVEEVIRLKTAFSSMEALLNAGGRYRPSLCVSDPDMLRLADAYDAEQERRGDSRRAYRYGDPVPTMRTTDAGTIYVNQGKRRAYVQAIDGDLALLWYQMPAGRIFFWEVPADTPWVTLREEPFSVRIRNVSRKKAPARWIAAIAEVQEDNDEG